MSNNFYPDQTKSGRDINYHQLRILASDLKSRSFNQGQIGSSPISQPQTGTQGGDDTPTPPGDVGCKLLYVANLTQSGEANPSVSVYENTIGNIIWTRTGEGVYLGTLVSAFPIGKTWVDINTNYLKGIDDKQAKFNVTTSANIVEIRTESGGSLSDDILDFTSIEIRTYCTSEETPGVELGEFIISQTTEQLEGRVGHFEITLDAGRTGYIDWGDGSDLEAFDSGAGGTMIKEHTYLIDGTYSQIFYFDANAAISNFVNDTGAESPDLTAFSHTDNFTGLQKVKLYGVLEIADVMPTAATNISFFEIFGGGGSTQTDANLSTLPATITDLFIRQFNDLVNITGIPATVTNQVGFTSNAALATASFSGALPPFIISISNAFTLATVTSWDLSTVALMTLIQSFSTSDVNAILVYVDSFGTSGLSLSLVQSPSAPPSGAGLTAKSNLQARGWTVTTN